MTKSSKAPKAAKASTTFSKYEGEVLDVYASSDQEILKDLKAVVDAVNLKPVRITKSGIPPKPLWAAINNRMVWRDPAGILHDWEGTDQVRFAFRLAMGFDLIRADEDGWLQIGPGCEQLFLARPVDRAHLFKRGYGSLWDWDERCDARDKDGHRYNFGKAYRRDFLHDVFAFRETLFERLSRLPKGWVRTEELTRALTAEVPDLLLTEVCEVPSTEGVDPEKQRLVDFWFTLLGRFGWVDLGRTAQSDRVVRFTGLGRGLVFGTPPPKAAPAARCVVVEAGPVLSLTTDLAHASDVLAFERLTMAVVEDAKGVLTSAAVERAIDYGVDVAACAARLLKRAKGPGCTELEALIAAVMEARAAVCIVENAIAIELGDGQSVAAIGRGTSVVRSGNLVVGAADSIHVLARDVGGEPEAGFDFPTEEPLAVWDKGPTLQFYYDASPLIHRDLIELLVEGEPPHLVFSADSLSRTRQAGWSLEALLGAIEQLTHKAAPPKVERYLKELASNRE